MSLEVGDAASLFKYVSSDSFSSSPRFACLLSAFETAALERRYLDVISRMRTKGFAAASFAKVATQSICALLTTTFGILCAVLTLRAQSRPAPEWHTALPAVRLKGGPGRVLASLAQSERPVRYGRFLSSPVHQKGGFVAVC